MKQRPSVVVWSAAHWLTSRLSRGEYARIAQPELPSALPIAANPDRQRSILPKSRAMAAARGPLALAPSPSPSKWISWGIIEFEATSSWDSDHRWMKERGSGQNNVFCHFVLHDCSLSFSQMRLSRGTLVFSSPSFDLPYRIIRRVAQGALAWLLVFSASSPGEFETRRKAWGSGRFRRCWLPACR
jgi:hypothetical protein